MPPEDRFVTRFAAEPPQDALPSGRWADTLTAEFLAACLRIDSDGEDLGEADVPTYFPDRTWNGRTYVPVTARTTTNLEVFGYVSFVPGDPQGSGDEQEPSDFASSADFTRSRSSRATCACWAGSVLADRRKTSVLSDNCSTPYTFGCSTSIVSRNSTSAQISSATCSSSTRTVVMSLV